MFSTEINLPKYKYMGEMASLLYLKKNTVRFSQPSTYNDPFELAPQVRLKRNISKTIFQMSVKLNGGNGLIKDYEIPVEKIDDYPFEMKSGWLKGFDSKIGTTCFSYSSSEVPINILMWAHYADSHRGISIQIKENSEIDDSLTQITYVGKRPLIDGEYFVENTEVFLSDLFFKSMHWSYEHELRMARNLEDCINLNKKDGYGNNIYVGEIPQSCIERIVLGVNASKCLKKLAHEFHRKTNIQVVFMRTSNSGFGFTPYTVLGSDLGESQNLLNLYAYETTQT